MIFKTINSSVDETRKTLALFNKDWNTYKANWQNANGIGAKIGSIFTSSSNANAAVISNNQVQILRNWNNAVTHGCTNQETFNRIIADADDNTKMYFAGLNKSKGSIEGLKNAQNVATQSTIGLTIAETALNAAIGMGIGLLVSLVVQGIDKLIHANEEAIEKAEGLRRKYEEFKSTNESNVTTLKGLEREFKELSKGVSQYGDNVSLTTEQYERYQEIIQQIVGISPSLAEGYSTENGYIADKNGLLERAIELQEQEYRNELRKATNLDNLKTSMSGYIAEYKKAFNGGLVTNDMSAISTTTATDFSNALYRTFNLNGTEKHNYDNTEKIARKIIESLGIDDVDSEIQKYINQNGIFESSWFFNAYADIIAENIEVITNSLSADIVGLDETVFDQNIEKVDSAAQSYLDMKDAISMANEYIQRDLGYIAEYTDGYTDLSTEQQKFANEFLKNYNISDIMSESNNPFDQGWKFDKDKMASVKHQIENFVETLSQDETTKTALADLYAIPTDEQSICEFVEQFKNALEVIQAYCKENGVEIPITISNREQSINNLEAQYQRTVDFAKDKFDGYDPGEFFKEHSINTQEEIDVWQKIAEGARNASEAEKEYLNQRRKPEDSITPTISSSIKQMAAQLEPQFTKLGEAYKSIFTSDGFTLDNIDNSMLEGLRQSFAEIGEDVGVAFDASVLDPFFDTLTSDYADSEEGAKQVQQAFNDLATAYLYSTDTMKQLNAETADAVEKQLEKMGIQNAGDILEEVMDAQQKFQAVSEQLGMTLEEVAGATYEEAVQMLFKAQADSQDTQALWQLAVAKGAITDGTISTESNVEALLAEAQAAGLDVATLTALENVRNGNIKDTNAAQAIMEQARQSIIASMSDFKLDLDFSTTIDPAGNAGAAAGDAYVDAFEEELSELEQLKSDGVITEKEYLDRLRTLNEQYFKDKLGYEKQFSKYQRQYLEGYKSLYESALSGITKLMSSRIDGYTESKDAAIESLEAEKQAAEDAYQSQIDAIDDMIDRKKETIDSIRDEIDAMKEAREERKREIDLQKARYDLERMKNQRTILQYSEERGLHYVSDESGIRDAKEAVDDAKFEIEVASKEKEIRLLENEIDLLEKQKNSLAEAQEASNKYYDSLIKQQEEYWDSMIRNMEQQKSKWEELAEIEGIADAYSKVKQVFNDLGYSVEDVLNGNEQAFEDFKSKYIGILSDMNNNTSFAEGLSYAAGITQENVGSIISDVSNSMQQLSQAFSDGTLADAISKGISEGMVSAQQELDKMKQLGDDAGEGFIEGWNEKSGDISDATKQTSIDAVEAFAEGQDSNSPSEKYKGLAGDAIDGLLLGVEEKRQSFIDSIRSLAEEGLLAFKEGFLFDSTSMETPFDGLKLLIGSVSDSLDLDAQSPIGGLMSALEQLSIFSLGNTEDGENIVSQFQSLKAAVDDVINTISGGGSSCSADGTPSGLGTNGKSSGSLTDAINSIKTAADQSLGSGGEENAEGTGSGVIGQFGQLKNAVDEVSTAIGTGDSEDDKNADGDQEDAANLTSAITGLGDTTEEILVGGGKSGNESGGVIGRFEEFKDVIGEAKEHVTGISEGLTAIDGQEVECTIKITIEQDGEIPVIFGGSAGVAGTALNTMNLSSAQYDAQYLGNAHVEGTALVSGNWAVQSDAGNALLGEVGYEIIVRNGRFFTVGNSGAEMFPIKKGDIVFNHEQSKQLLKYGRISGRGRAYADGTVGGGKFLTPNGDILRPLLPGDRTWELQKTFEPLLNRMNNHLEYLADNARITYDKQMQTMLNPLNTANGMGQGKTDVHITGGLNITCPGVTSQEVVKQVGMELNHMFNGLHLDAMQQSMIR